MTDPDRRVDDVTIHQVGADDVRPLRRAVLRPGQPPAASMYPHDRDLVTGHFAALHGDQVAGVASVLREDCPRRAALVELPPVGDAWRLRGMAVEAGHRHQGIGARLLTRCVAHVLDHGGRVLWCNARVGAIAFYRAYGWRTISEEFGLGTIGAHRVMRLDLPTSHPGTDHPWPH